MSRKAGSVSRSRALRIAGAVGAGVMVLGMVTVGAAVAADSGSGDRVSVTSPGGHKSREAAPKSLNGPGGHKSREAAPRALNAPGGKKSREAAPLSLTGPGAKKSRESAPVLDAYAPKKSREAAPSAE